MTANVISVSWGDHLVFGDGVGRLATPDHLARRMEVWRDDLGARSMHWRENGSYAHLGRTRVARGYKTRIVDDNRVDWDELPVASRLAREAGLEPWLYVTPLSEGWPLAPKRVREVSHHNPWHGREVAWQSHFSRAHPEFAEIDRSGAVRQWGVMSLAYPDVRAYHRERFLEVVEQGDWAGLFVCLRSESKPAEFADEFGFNEPIRADFHQLTGCDIVREDFDLQAWRDLHGSYLTRFLTELREDLAPRGIKLGLGCARGDVIGPPFGNATLPWRTWLRDGVIDRLVVDQNSSVCPSLWIRLWPMHAGYGYLQNYLEGRGLPPLEDHLRDTYGPIATASSANLFAARMWHERSPAEEERLAAVPGVAGLVFGSFRFDNREAVARADWWA